MLTNVVLQRKVLAESHWEILIKAVGQLLGTAKRAWESH
jgi:hypothetical protein